MLKKKLLVRNLHYNKKTNQLSLTLPKKKIKLDDKPKKVKIKIEEWLY